jgi:hypothetical protein
LVRRALILHTCRRPHFKGDDTPSNGSPACASATYLRIHADRLLMNGKQ